MDDVSTSVNTWLGKESYGLSNMVWVILSIVAIAVVWYLCTNRREGLSRGQRPQVLVPRNYEAFSAGDIRNMVNYAGGKLHDERKKYPDTGAMLAAWGKRLGDHLAKENVDPFHYPPPTPSPPPPWSDMKSSGPDTVKYRRVATARSRVMKQD